MKDIKVRLTFIEPILGTASGNKDLHTEFIASKAPDAKSREEEIEALGADEVERKEMTVFARDENGHPILWNYHIKGFFKHACQMLKMVKGTESEKIKAYKKLIDGLVFVNERQIPIMFEGEIGNLQRPLRAQTMQGERVALANSEMIPSGATVSFTVRILQDSLEKTILEWLDYGQYNGLGQWRSASYGSFHFVAYDKDANYLGGNK